MLQEDRESSFWAIILFSVAAITDWLDGYLARKRGLVSVLGKLLDPLADKLIVMATLIVAAQLGNIPGWVVVLLLAKHAVRAPRPPPTQMPTMVAYGPKFHIDRSNMLQFRQLPPWLVYRPIGWE